MKKIVNRRSVNYKLFLLLLILFYALGYFLFEQFYSFKKKEILNKIDFLITENQKKKAQVEIENYVTSYGINKAIVERKISILSKEIEAKPELSAELIRLIFFRNSLYSTLDDNLDLTLGKTYFSKGKNYYAQSKFYLERYLIDKPYDQEIYQILYQINFRLAFFQEAKFYLTQLLQKNPDSEELKINYVQLLLLMYEELSAQELLEKFIVNEDYNDYTFLASKLLLEVLYKFNLEKKIIFYDNLIHIKYKEHKDFIKEFDEFHLEIKLKQE